MSEPRKQGHHLRFYLVDVFTREPLTGNPLIVVADAEELEESVMASIAREFNQSETTFVLPPTLPDADWRLRSFTPLGVEVFGAGHNSLGAWWWMAEYDLLELDGPSALFNQEIGERVLAVEIMSRDGFVSAIGMMQTPPSFGAVCDDLPELAAALGLTEADFIGHELPAQVVSTGAAHLLVPVLNRAVVESAHPDVQRLAALLAATGGQGCYVFSLEPADSAATAHARFFNPTVGIWEDPATGSAAGPLACYLVARGVVNDDSTVAIEQGHEAGRPARIEVHVRGTEVRVYGSAVVIGEGTLRL